MLSLLLTMATAAATPPTPVVPTPIPVTEWQSPAVVTDASLPAGPLFHPVRPDQVSTLPVPVPEPVWCSVAAATALVLLRRRDH